MKTLIRLLPSIPDGLGQPMQISPERAFWILDFYRRHRTLLHLEGKIFDQEAAGLALITAIDATFHSMTVRIFGSVETASWDRKIALRHLRYFFSQMQDSAFKDANDRHARNFNHSVLRLEFMDGTELCFSERIAPRHPTATDCIPRHTVSTKPMFAC